MFVCRIARDGGGSMEVHRATEVVCKIAMLIDNQLQTSFGAVLQYFADDPGAMVSQEGLRSYQDVGLCGFRIHLKEFGNVSGVGDVIIQGNNGNDQLIFRSTEIRI